MTLSHYTNTNIYRIANNNFLEIKVASRLRLGFFTIAVTSWQISYILERYIVKTATATPVMSFDELDVINNCV